MLPSALDVPQWARFTIQAARDKFQGLTTLTDNEIYATLRDGGFNVARSEQRLDLENHRRELAAQTANRSPTHANED